MYGLLGSDNIWPRYNRLKTWNLRVQKNQNIEKIAFKVVQMKFLSMHITNQKLSFNIFTVVILLHSTTGFESSCLFKSLSRDISPAVFKWFSINLFLFIFKTACSLMPFRLLQIEDKKWWRIYLFTCSHVRFRITFFLTLSLSLPSTLSIYPNQKSYALSVGKYYTIIRENSCGSMTRDSFALCQFLLVALNVNIWVKPRK